MVMTERMRAPVRVGFYDIEKTIGKGNFAVVKLARHRITKTEVAIKIIDKSQLDFSNMQKVYREVKILKSLNHPHIIKLFQVMESKNMLYIVSEYASQGEIFDYIAKYGRMDERASRKTFWQILSAVEYCHNNNIVHRDLKAENLLLDGQMNVKIADWGFANYYTSSGLLNTWCGSPPYAAPEVFAGKRYIGPEIDIWSLGVVLYVLVCGALPFDGATLPELRDRVMSGRFRIPYFMSSDCEHLLRKTLVLEPSRRYTVKHIKRHRWMQMDCSSVVLTESPAFLRAERTSEPNEQVLRIMQELGVDVTKTRESLVKETYDNYGSIYLLLLDRLQQHRSSVQFDRQAWLDQHRKVFRSSSVAEAALRRAKNKASGKCSPLPVHSQSLFSYLPPTINVDPNAILNLCPPVALQESPVFHNKNHHGRQLPSVPCYSASPQTAYNDSLNAIKSGASSLPIDTSYSGGEPTLYKEDDNPSLKTTSVKTYREGESGASTSIDEGVELDTCDSDSGSITSHCRSNTSGFLALRNLSQQSETSSDSPLGSVTSNVSNFESFESQLEPDLCETFPSASQTSSQCVRPFTSSLSSAPQRKLLPGHSKEMAKEYINRQMSRSPVGFREGRRASDGLMAQGTFAFRQRLMEAEKTGGVTELNNVKKEHQALTNCYQWLPNNEEYSKQQEQHNKYWLDWRQSGSSFCSKRVSLPDKLYLATQKTYYSKEMTKDADMQGSGSPKSLHQQMFHHRLQQKRQMFQKQSLFPRNSYPAVACSDLSRRQMVRQSSYKTAQQQTVLPPLPTNVSSAHLMGDIYPPIAEDGIILEQGEEDQNLFPGDNQPSMYYVNYQTNELSESGNSNIRVTLSGEPNLYVSSEPSSLLTTHCIPNSNYSTIHALPSSFEACHISDQSHLFDGISISRQSSPHKLKQSNILSQISEPQEYIKVEKILNSETFQDRNTMVHEAPEFGEKAFIAEPDEEDDRRVKSSLPSLNINDELKTTEAVSNAGSSKDDQRLEAGSLDEKKWIGLHGWHGSSLFKGKSLGTSSWYSATSNESPSSLQHQVLCESPILEMPENMES